MSRRTLVAMGVVLFGALVWYGLQSRMPMARLVEHERQLRGVIAAHPWGAFSAAFLAYVVISLCPGTSGKSVVAGWFFGFWPALGLVTFALTIAGVVGFSVARYLLSDVLRSRFRVPLDRFDRAVQRDGLFYLLTVRLLHVPFTLVNYAAGVSAVPLRTFAWTTLLGLVPSTMVFVGLGAGLPSLGELQDQGAASLLSPPLVLALAAMGVVPWLVRSVVRRLRRRQPAGGHLHVSPREGGP